METTPDHPTETLTVEVFAPTDRHPRRFAFNRTETVGAAAESAARDFGLHPTAPSFEVEGTKIPLDRSKTLADAGVHDGEKLELVDVGGGV